MKIIAVARAWLNALRDRYTALSSSSSGNPIGAESAGDESLEAPVRVCVQPERAGQVSKRRRGRIHEETILQRVGKISRYDVVLDDDRN